MFVGNGKPRKPAERAAARELREQGHSYKRIAAELGISPSSAFNWTRDIELTAEQIAFNLGRGFKADSEVVNRRARTWSAVNRERRRVYQREGRERARIGGDPLHQTGCMLYWAEGAKHKNCAKFSNSDVAMVAFFRRFLTECFDIQLTKLRFTVHVYLGNGLSISDIEEHWLTSLTLPRSCLRKHQINPLPTSSSGLKRNRLPYGVGNLSYCDTHIVQHIFGAIQEYAGFEEPRWLG